MPRTRQSAEISARKTPRQSRSNQLVAAILEAASRVLARDGAHRFTTARVAEAAGVSVGSLYQYFPNKQSILFRLQSDEWQQTSGLMEKLLTDKQLPPFDRLRETVRAFFRSECEEAELRVALAGAVPMYRDAPERSEQRKEGKARVVRFMALALPGVPARERALIADLVGISMSATGKQISEQGRSRAEVDALAVAMGDMYCAYLETLARR